MDFKRIILIGSGRVATQLGIQLHRQGKSIIQVYSRNLQHAESLAAMIGAVPIADFSKISREADLYIMAVSDNAISEVSKFLRLENKTVVHTSGSTPMSVIGAISSNHGVFYPLQTFTKQKPVDFSKIPFCIEASTEATQSALFALAGEFSQNVRYITSQQRLMLHVAAVFVSNFTNYMYLMGEELLQSAGIPFDILKPLIAESALKINHLMPHEAQTGPALRNDEETIKKHLDILQQFPDKEIIYKMLSENINQHFNNKE